MFRKFQISLAYLGLIIILFHGAIPHHHHEATHETECNGLVHSEPHSDCDFTEHQHNTDKEFVCHFKVVSNKLSIDKYFAIVTTTDFLSFCFKQKTHYSDYKSPLFSFNNHKFPSFRAPPVIA